VKNEFLGWQMWFGVFKPLFVTLVRTAAPPCWHWSYIIPTSWQVIGDGVVLRRVWGETWVYRWQRKRYNKAVEIDSWKPMLMVLHALSSSGQICKHN